jgi:hypothetical protein
MMAFCQPSSFKKSTGGMATVEAASEMGEEDQRGEGSSFQFSVSIHHHGSRIPF